VAQVIQKSSNVGTAKIGAVFSPRRCGRMFDGVGFGTAAQARLSRRGRRPPAPGFKTWRPIEQATMSYGHGISVTLIQLARAYLVFARDGDLMPMSLTRLDTPPLAGKAGFSAQTARECAPCSRWPCSPAAPRPRRRLPATASPARPARRTSWRAAQYADKYVASFVGFAPVSDPRLVVAVMIDEPSNGKYYGGEVAAPVFAQVMGGSLRTLGVAPDAPLKPVQVASAEAVPESL
jgi:cell division protein FtsI (penicillin-binding protein 3)